jgi:putative PIN family toxin of toxin-antitoxin system
MIVVIDCNIVVAAGTKDGFVRHVVRGIIDRHEIIITGDIIAEYERVAEYPKFGAAASAYMKSTIGQIEGCARLIEPRASGLELPDADDVAYVDAAVSGGADFVITGNLKHFPERQYGSARVVSVREFAELAGLLP